MNKYFFAFLLLFLLTSVAGGCGTRREASPPPPPAREEPVKREPEPSPVTALVEERCVRCHDLTRVYRIRKKEAWPGIVTRMAGMSPGLLSAQEQELVVRYLQENYGE
jgi:hypothetical protein